MQTILIGVIQMLIARVYRHENDEDGIFVQLMVIPRIGETISLPDDDNVERDRKIISVNHWIRPTIEGRLQQVEVVVFCTPDIAIRP